MRLSLWLGICCLQAGIISIAHGQSNRSWQLTHQDDQAGGWCIQLELSAEETFDTLAFKVFVAKEWAERHQQGQPIAGRLAMQQGNIWLFVPYFPFTEGMQYVAVYPGRSPFEFHIPKTKRPSTKLMAIFPTQDTIPENLLKIYLHFSAPMSVGNSYQHLYWLNEVGDTLEIPFLPLEPELWNDDRTRLTLWFDPGRVKRDLVPNQLRGAPLVEGRRYLLRVSKNWKDKHGNPLAKDESKSLIVGPADRTKPDPGSWKIQLPSSASLQPLTLYFGEALDHALLQHSISLWSEGQKPVEGVFEIGQEQGVWAFYPAQSWTAGHYTLRIDTKLEDLAGNNLNRLFDVDLQASTQALPDKAYYYLKFTIPFRK